MKPLHSAVFGAFLLVSTALAHGQSLETHNPQHHPNDIETRLTAVKYEARTNELTAEKILLSVDQALSSAAIITSSVTNDRLIHLELKRLASELRGTRAIIVIGPDGKLLHDSYRYPIANLDLADRTYFKAAQSRHHLYVGETVVGRTSGANFVPLAKRLGDLTFVAIVTPLALVDVQTDCADCWSIALQDDGDLVSAFPPELQVSRSLRKAVADDKRDIGTSIMRYGGSVIAVAWRKMADYPVVSVSVRGLPDTAAVEVNLN